MATYRMRVTLKLPVKTTTPALTATQEDRIDEILRQIPAYLRTQNGWSHLDSAVNTMVETYPVPD